MKFNKILTIALALSAVLAMAIKYDNATAADGTATAEVLTNPDDLTMTQEAGEGLNFGKFYKASGANGTVTIAANGSRTSSNVTVEDSGSGHRQGVITITGAGDSQSFATISIPATVNLSDGGANTMQASLRVQKTGTANNTNSISNVTANAGGEIELTVHGVLNVAQNQATGSYTAGYDVTVAAQ